MSNIRTAKAAIKAEIIHAKKELNVWAQRVDSLEQALAGLTHFGQDASEGSAESKPARKTSKSKSATPMKTPRKSASRASDGGKQAGELPSTGGDYWPNLVSEEPKSGAQILKSAIDQLEFTPTSKQIKMLQQRQTFALNAMVKAGKIQDQGSGRGRVYFKS